jgi:hypothetical protein
MSDPVAASAPAVEEKGEADAEFSLGDFSGMKKKKKKKVVAEEKTDVAAAEAGVEAGSASAVAAPVAPQEVGVLAAGESEGRPHRHYCCTRGWLLLPSERIGMRMRLRRVDACCSAVSVLFPVLRAAVVPACRPRLQLHGGE